MTTLKEKIKELEAALEEQLNKETELRYENNELMAKKIALQKKEKELLVKKSQYTKH